MKILLTGATGFVGSHILEGLIKDGHTVYVLKRSHSDIKRIECFLGQCILYDSDELKLEQIFQESQIDCIIHCATYYGRNDEDCLKNIETNLLFPLRLLILGIEKGVKYFINTDSFFTKQIISETSLDTHQYMAGYTLSKIQFRQWGHMFATKYGIRFINMQLEHVYGEGDSEGKFIPYIWKACSSNVPSIALSEGLQKRDFVYILDVVEAYRIVINNLDSYAESSYVTYEVGTGEMRSLREFVELIHDAVHSRTILNWGEVLMKEGEILQSKANNIGLIELGWIPKVVKDVDIKSKICMWGGG